MPEWKSSNSLQSSQESANEAEIRKSRVESLRIYLTSLIATAAFSCPFLDVSHLRNSGHIEHQAGPPKEIARVLTFEQIPDYVGAAHTSTMDTSLKPVQAVGHHLLGLVAISEGSAFDAADY